MRHHQHSLCDLAVVDTERLHQLSIRPAHGQRLIWTLFSNQPSDIRLKKSGQRQSNTLAVHQPITGQLLRPLQQHP